MCMVSDLTRNGALQEDGNSSHRRHTHAAHNPEWLQGDAILAAATASCVAADVKCKVIPIGPLPSSQVSSLFILHLHVPPTLTTCVAALEVKN